MGLDSTTANAIIREHLYRPITGDVFAVGRQTLFFSPAYAIELLKANGIAVNAGPEDLPVESLTVHKGFVQMEAFFSLLGIRRMRSIDHSDYEGADVIHDLNEPLPASLEGIADFIIDGSTLDNVWNPAFALQSLARMLKPGGRLFSVNAGSNHNGPYTILTSPWVFDYLLVNHFVDFRVYVFVAKDNVYNVFAVDHNSVAEALPLENIESPHLMGIFFIAEKGPRSTWNKVPIQHQYQTQEQRDQFCRMLQHLSSSTRPDIFGSTVEPFINIPKGYRFVSSGVGACSASVRSSVPKAPVDPPVSSFASRVATALRGHPLLYVIARGVYRVVTGK